MKNGLWAGLSRRYRARLCQRMGERGAAMMLAVLFVMVVLTTSALVMTILLSQALPYRNNKENAQVGYAAESGLEVALSFLREAEASKDYKKLLPSTASNTGNASLDETFTTASDGSVLLNNAEVSNDVSATGVSSFTPDDISYRVQIGYYDDDPSSSPAKRLTSESELKNAKYAWVRSYGYINRYPNGRSAGTETSARRAMSAIYQFETASGDDSYVISTKGGRLGMGFYAAAPNNERRTNQPTWKEIASYDVDENGDPTGMVNYVNKPGSKNAADAMSNTITMNPANQTCMLATTKPVDKVETLDAMLDPNGKPVEGSALVILMQAHKKDSSSDDLYYTEQCKANGAYKDLNTWVYWKDDSIRPASNLTLCVTGADITHVGGGTAGAATLQKCGESYGPNYQNDYYTDPDKKAQQDEKNDPSSLLNKCQKWAFYNGFINAGYYNELDSVRDEANKYDASLPESQGYVVGGMQMQKKTRFQVLEVSNKANVGATIQYLSGGHWASNVDDAADLTPHFLMVSKWDYSLTDVKSWFDVNGDFEDATASFGQAGEAGYATKQIVNETSGFCISSSQDGFDAYTSTCRVGGGDFNPYCYHNTINGNPAQSSSDLHQIDYCGVSDSTKRKTDQAEYVEDTSSDGSGVNTQIWTMVNGSKRCYGFGGSGKFQLMECSAAPTFTRYNEKASDEHSKGTFQLNGQCLTEVYPGDKIDGNPSYSGRIDGHADVIMAKCGSSRDFLNREIKSQVWNASVNLGTGGSGGGVIYGGGSSTTLEPSSTKGYVTSKELNPSTIAW